MFRPWQAYNPGTYQTSNHGHAIPYLGRLDVLVSLAVVAASLGPMLTTGRPRAVAVLLPSVLGLVTVSAGSPHPVTFAQTETSSWRRRIQIGTASLRGPVTRWPLVRDRGSWLGPPSRPALFGKGHFAGAVG